MKLAVKSRFLLAGVPLVGLGLLVPSATAQPCIAPNGDIDTDVLQAALEECSGGPSACTVRLCEGRFLTAPLRVGGFQGTLVGAGRESTVIEALPDLRVNDRRDGYWRDPPLDPALPPWPYLLQFIDGRGRVQDLTIEIPSTDINQRPTQGWTEIEGLDPSFELAGAILMTGRAPGLFEVTRVGILAGEDLMSPFFGTTLLSGVSIRGLMLNPEDLSGFPVFPVGGPYQVSDSVFDGMVSAVSLGELDDADVTIRGNEMSAFVAVDLLDASRSQVRVLENRWAVTSIGFNAFLNIDGTPSVGNTILIRGNRGATGPDFGFGTGIFFQDPWILPEPGNSLVLVYGNELEVGNPEEAGYAAIEIVGAGRAIVRRNTLRGRVEVFGLGLDETTRCRVFFNDFGALDTGGGPDLRLGPGTSQCFAILRRDDSFVDEGTGNRILQRRR